MWPNGAMMKTGSMSWGVSDDQYGLAVFDFVRDGLRAHNAWFFFDKEYVCLGSHIKCTSANQVMTTVNQCYLNGDVTTFYGTSGKRLSKGEHELKAPTAVYHDNVAYIFPEDANILIKNNAQEGSWNLISKSRSNEKISHDVFTLCVDHGVKPTNATYFYVVCPAMSVQQARVYAKQWKWK